MEKKNRQNVMYYAKSMTQSEWFACICAFGIEEKVFTETDIARDLYVDESEDLDLELNDTMRWVLSFRYLVKIWERPRLNTQSSAQSNSITTNVTSSSKQTMNLSNFTIKHNKRDMELCRMWEEQIESSSNTPRFKPLYKIPESLFRKERWTVREHNKRFVKSYSMKREIEDNLEFHMKDIPYWERESIMDENIKSMIDTSNLYIESEYMGKL